MIRFVRRTLDENLVVTQRDFHVVVQSALQLALRTFHLNGVALDLGGDAFRECNRMLANS